MKIVAFNIIYDKMITKIEYAFINKDNSVDKKVIVGEEKDIVSKFIDLISGNVIIGYNIDNQMLILDAVISKYDIKTKTFYYDDLFKMIPWNVISMDKAQKKVLKKEVNDNIDKRIENTVFLYSLFCDEHYGKLYSRYKDICFPLDNLYKTYYSCNTLKIKLKCDTGFYIISDMSKDFIKFINTYIIKYNEYSIDYLIKYDRSIIVSYCLNEGPSLDKCKIMAGDKIVDIKPINNIINYTKIVNFNIKKGFNYYDNSCLSLKNNMTERDYIIELYKQYIDYIYYHDLIIGCNDIDLLLYRVQTLGKKYYNRLNKCISRNIL